MLKYVNTESGVLSGMLGYDPRITVFAGVPYAAPPVGELRWRAPQPMPRWEGVRAADHYAPMAIQHPPGVDPFDFWTRELHPAGPDFEMSEDCLYVNIFTPAKTGNEKLPVLFYIHGGGYQGGYPYEIEFDWEHMARKGIVVVAVTYRLGIFGFLAHPELSDPSEPCGNWGIQDQLAALKWTKRNIAGFGGDPERITIAGQSAGAGSVQCLLTSPLADGLINGAIIQSSVSADFADMGGGFMTPGVIADAERQGDEFFRRAGISSLAEARSMPAMELFERSKHAGRGIFFAPAVDGVLLTEAPFRAYLNDHHHRVPILTGYNRGEVGAFSRWRGPKTLETLRDFSTRYGEHADDFLTLCAASSDEDAEAVFSSDAFTGMVAGAYLFGTLQAREGRRTFLYEFDAQIPGSDNPGSFHGSELSFAYDSLARSWRPYTGRHYDLARQISSYWVNFVRNGDPNGRDCLGFPLPEWKAFDEDEQFMMLFTDEPKQRDAKIDDIMRFRIEHTLAAMRSDDEK